MKEKCFIKRLFVSMSNEAKPLCFSLCSRMLMMLNDAEYATFKMIVTQISNYLFVVFFSINVL